VNTEAKLMLLERAFEVLGAEKVFWYTDIRNERSQQAIARLGATRDGLIRRQRLRPDGTWRDTVLFAMTAEEWPAAANASAPGWPRHDGEHPPEPHRRGFVIFATVRRRWVRRGDVCKATGFWTYGHCRRGGAALRMGTVLGITEFWTYVLGTVAIVLLPGPNSIFVLTVGAQRGRAHGLPGRRGGVRRRHRAHGARGRRGRVPAARVSAGLPGDQVRRRGLPGLGSGSASSVAPGACGATAVT
jgi:hypothetical protein